MKDYGIVACIICMLDTCVGKVSPGSWTLSVEQKAHHIADRYEVENTRISRDFKSGWANKNTGLINDKRFQAQARDAPKNGWLGGWVRGIDREIEKDGV